ncbi:MAG: hypothetical protein NXH95_14350 [Pseudomonadaceae bacterium]|nr:hypothetical protein [Pseudomonadaceae bacterium]
MKEIVSGDLSNFPANNPLLVKNPVLQFMASIPKDNFEVADPIQREFATKSEYQHSHPTVRIFEPPERGINYPYFEASRTPSSDEVRDAIAPRFGVARLLHEHGVPIAEIAEALMFHDVCGDESIRETVRVRPLWGLFLVASNVSNGLLNLDAIHGELELSEDLSYRELNRKLERTHIGELPLPRMAVPDGASIVIPIATAIGPLQEATVDASRSEFMDLPTGAYQRVIHGKLSERKKAISLVGSAINPTALVLRSGNLQTRQTVHTLDIDNMYIVDRGFEAGSCPHLFLEYRTSRLVYIQELWAHSPRVEQQHELVVPEGATAIVIAELEFEITRVARIEVNGFVEFKDIYLSKGEELRVPVSERDHVVLVGSYDPVVEPITKAPWTKNNLIRDFLSSQHTSTLSSHT